MIISNHLSLSAVLYNRTAGIFACAPIRNMVIDPNLLRYTNIKELQLSIDDVMGLC